MKIIDNYIEIRIEAQARANQTGLDQGIEKVEFGHAPGAICYRHFALPCRKNRRGHELRCEVISCESLEKCRPGHGPLA